jgi:hypothetical protein
VVEVREVMGSAGLGLQPSPRGSGEQQPILYIRLIKTYLRFIDEIDIVNLAIVI